jgi:hypothetical protein
MAVAAIPLALAAASEGLNYYNQSNTNNKQQDAEKNALLDQQAKQKQAAGIVQNQVNNVAKSTPQAEQAAATQGFINTLRSNAGTSAAMNPAVTGANKRYNTDTAAATSGANDYSTGLANSMAGIVAPQRQRMDEGQGFQDTATQVGGVQQQAQQQAFIDQLKAKSIQENPWMTLGSKVLGLAAGATTGLGGAGSGLFNSGNLGLSTGTAAAPQVGNYARYAVNLPGGI